MNSKRVTREVESETRQARSFIYAKQNQGFAKQWVKYIRGQGYEYTVEIILRIIPTELFGNNRRIYVRRMPVERFNNYYLVPTMKHGGGSIMVWGGISVNGVTPLKKNEGIMDKKMYHSILVRQAMPAGKRWIGSGFNYYEDNAPKHASKLFRNYLQKKRRKR